MCKIARARRSNRHGFAGDFAHAVGLAHVMIARCRDRDANQRPAACAKSPFDAVPAACRLARRFCTPLYGDFFVKRFFTRTLIFFASLVPFLRSVSLFDRRPFLRPDLPCRRDAARSCGQGWPVFGPPPEAARNASLTAASTVSRCTGSGRMDRSWRAAARRYALSDQRGACGLVGEFPRLTTLYAVSRARARP